MATIGQASNKTWFEQRKGQINASNFYRVHTRIETIKSSEEGCADPQKLIESLLGIQAPPHSLHALKYGQNMEKIAADKYLKSFEKQHQNVTYRECGLFVHQSKPFLSASPDLLVEGSCCGAGVLEIKCPYSILNEVPTAKNVPYLKIKDGRIILKKNHAYFAQVQGDGFNKQVVVSFFGLYPERSTPRENRF